MAVGQHTEALYIKLLSRLLELFFLEFEFDVTLQLGSKLLGCYLLESALTHMKNHAVKPPLQFPLCLDLRVVNFPYKFLNFGVLKSQLACLLVLFVVQQE